MLSTAPFDFSKLMQYNGQQNAGDPGMQVNIPTGGGWIPGQSDNVGPPQGMSGPSNDVWAGIDPRLAQLYQSHGIKQPGAAGSGFTDAAYWNNTLNNGAGGDWNYINNRLGSDLSGNGPDTPGPGDSGNKSGGLMNAVGGGIGGLLQSLLGGGSNNSGEMNGGGSKGSMNSGPTGSSVPYNQYSGMNQHQMNQGQQQPPPIMSQPSSTSSNGTLVGTQFSQPTTQTQPTTQPTNAGGNTPTVGIRQKPSPFSQQTTMSAPSFYNNANNTQPGTNQKPNSFSYSGQTGMNQ
jgi:hypothetical protein